ncbi:MAG: DNA translocase FtsK 4TM domain-containing protein [Deltaproteobacteria bacterium]|nr:DNA translocase FtsK 4TM domain-containing protein [Deltaproteobacteria bacterium]
MAKRRAGRAKKSGSASSPLWSEVSGLALVALGLLSGIALWTHSPWDPSLSLEPVRNAAGPVGATLAAGLLGGFGSAAWVAAAGMVLLGGRLAAGRGLPPLSSRIWAGAALLLVALAPMASLLEAAAPSRFEAWSGGWFGGRLGALEAAVLGIWGALLVNGLLALVAVLNLAGIPVARAAEAAAWAAQTTWEALARTGTALGRGLAQAVGEARRVAISGLTTAAATLSSLSVYRERRARRARVAAARDIELEVDGSLEEALQRNESSAAPAARLRRRGAEPDIVDHQAVKAATPKQETFTFPDDKPRGPYQLPDVAIFEPPPSGRRTYDRESLIMNSRILEKKLGDFGISGRVVKVHPGPVVTMYEYEPASGVKLNRIVGLTDDLALALRALSVRIIAPLPGKSVVGIEVANPEREVVTIREILESENFRKNSYRLGIALGKDIFGNSIEADLARMPHLLVAGATGTGKSVFLNSLLCSILFRSTPEQLKLLLVDPKLLELSIYEGIPHLIADVVTNPKRAAAALSGIVAKMEDRYRMMQALTVRSIAQFNDRVDDLRKNGEESFRLRAKPGEEEGEERPLERLPYILVVIDELADLMVVSARDVEESLQRLAQMARAAGIHLVLATQRPSVDVLTGVIKANFPARISFQVSSRTDSRTILDQNGAEVLLGMGDMLFLPPGTSKLQRIHGSYVSEKEVSRLVAFLREQGKPQFDETITRMEEESKAKEERGEDTDELYDRAIEIVAETGNASISYVQRRLKVGYNRAARMIEQMEIDGAIGPQEGTKPRQVFVRPMELE